MGNLLLYIGAIILLVSWAIGFFVFNAGSIIHILPVIALSAILSRLLWGRKTT